MARSVADDNERAIYACICGREGVKAREIAAACGIDKKVVNHYLYNSPFIHDLCYCDDQWRWWGLIRQSFPHVGLADYCGWYGTAADFMATSEDAWLAALEAGCARIGRNLNDARGLIHSFRDEYATMRQLFGDLSEVDCADWEVCFEVRIKRGRRVRIYTDVLVAAPGWAFSLEFKMKDAIEPEEVAQAAKYAPFLEVAMGPDVNVVPALVLTRAADLFTFEAVPGCEGEIAVCSGDMLFNVFDEYLGFLAR